ncbi:MAG: glucose-1-phosphate adenylyltransferase subunit GlgD [Oscillospiraceae bacterium]
MTGNNIVGIVYSNMYDESLSEMTGLRTMGSVPFAGRYRLIDFALSNMVNSGIEKVGVITKSNYQSLMDHLGTGKPWDLSRKTEGMFILPPFSSAGNMGYYGGRVEALQGIMGFISRSSEEYILFSDCNTVINLDVDELMDYHTDRNADITIVYKNGKCPCLANTMTFDINENGRIETVAVSPNSEGNVNYSMNVILMKKSLIERLVNESISLNHEQFERDIIQRNTEKLKIYGFPVQGFARTIDSMQSYFSVSMELLNPENCQRLFSSERPIYTKVRDDMPAIYGLGSSVKNSLVASGCIIDGEVENSILFRGVRVEKGAVVKNSILMQGSFVAQGSSLNYTISDKSVVITPNKMLSGAENYPVFVGKGIVI